MSHEFSLSGGTLPRDNGHVILSGLSVRFPWIHGRPDLQIAPVRGTWRDKGARIRLDRGSKLHIRGLSVEEARELSLRWFAVHGIAIMIGEVREVPVVPYPVLVSHRVILRDKVDRHEVLSALLPLIDDPAVEVELGRRSTMRIHERQFVGHVVTLREVSPETSRRIQNTGIGIGTSMGCGVFYPSRRG